MQEQAVTDEVYETAKNRASVFHSSASDLDFIGPLWVHVHPTDGQLQFDQAIKAAILVPFKAIKNTTNRLYGQLSRIVIVNRDRKSTRLNSSHAIPSRMPSSA